MNLRVSDSERGQGNSKKRGGRPLGGLSYGFNKLAMQHHGGRLRVAAKTEFRDKRE